MNYDTLAKTKFNRLMFKILKLDRDNLNTREYTNTEMVERIRKMIEEEVKKCY